MKINTVGLDQKVTQLDVFEMQVSHLPKTYPTESFKHAIRWDVSEYYTSHLFHTLRVPKSFNTGLRILLKYKIWQL